MNLNEGTTTLHAETRGALRMADGDRVLNFGCGKMLLVPNSDERGVEYVNCDPIVVGNGIDMVGLYDWPYPDESFDAVVSFSVLEHVSEPARIVAEIYRVLKPGGVTWNRFSFLEHYHPYPGHYFNIAPDGAEYLFASFDHVDIFPDPVHGTRELNYVLQHWKSAAAKIGDVDLAQAITRVMVLESRARDKIIMNRDAISLLCHGAPTLVVHATK